MRAADLDGFFADADTLDPDAYLGLDYYMECRGDPRVAAAHFCSEQSTAQWRRVGSDEDLRGEFGAKVVDLRVEGTLPDFSYGVNAPGTGDVHACRLSIVHPHRNFGPRIPNLLSAVCGEGTFFSPGAPIVKLLDIRFPDAYLKAFEGPRFGVAGLRDLLGVYGRPIFFGVIKPNIGLPPEDMAELGLQGWLGGLDVAKDDEMLCDTDWCSLAERSSLLGAARRRAEIETGTPKVYLANVTDEVQRLTELHDLAVANGANALLINAVPMGLSAVRMLAQHTRVPLVAHFPMIAALSRLENFGISTLVLTKLQRLAGFDVVIMPGFGGRMFTSDAEVCRNAAACLEPMGSLRPSLPVPGGSDWAGTLKQVYDKLGTCDFGFVPGRGVFGHPMGPRGGAASIRQAWDAISAGTAIDEHARDHEELRAALSAFGGNA
jgi:ribulose-bisphosphate carboxylase large chain